MRNWYTHTAKRSLTILFILIMTVFPVIAQDGGEEQAPDTALIPVFPEETEGLIFIEGEDAVSTNFAKVPVYNYGCSGLKTLQLSRSTGLQGGAPFYAQYVVYVEKPGTYSFGYGGTPPGPADDLYPSYVSPFNYSIDEGEEQPVYREDTSVISGYTPAYYWVHIGEVELTGGIHTVTFRVSEKRGFDNTYFFYLDSFFFIEKNRLDTVIADPGRKLFPKNYADRSMDNQFLSIPEYTAVIQSRPEDPRPYIELSLVYSLIGDYLSALKMLKKAVILDPGDPHARLLMAKNKIWKGDVADGLVTYREVLKLAPDNPSFWMEAAKVAAWTNMYKEALDLYQKALDRFPDNLSLMVDTALTYLWMSRNEEAGEYLDRAEAAARDNPDTFAELGRVFMNSGYYGKAAGVYEHALEVFPEYLELYLLLETAYERLGMQEEADGVYEKISAVFQPSPELTRYLELYRTKSGLKREVIADYRKRIQEDPANLDVRSFLVQTYFWNGMRREAIDELFNILVSHGYNTFVDLDRRSIDLYEMIEILIAYDKGFTRIDTEAGKLVDALRERIPVYGTALKAAVKESESEEETGTAARDLFRDEEEKMNTLLAEVSGFLESASAGMEEYADRTALEGYVTKENEDKKAFELLTGDIGWRWDRRFHLAELGRVREREPVLAGYVLSRIYHFEENYQAAEALFEDPALSGSRLPPVLFARYQLETWNLENKPEEDVPLPSAAMYEYAPYIPEVESLPDELVEFEAIGYLYPDDTPAEAAKLLEELADARKDISSRRRELQGKLRILKNIARSRMERSFYRLEENTYLLRYELGDYYLTLDEPEPAVEQFRMVLSIDPWNISATYKLGTVQQLSGNWSRAMDSYRKVYWNDPEYANTVHYYNQLAREHADSFSFRSAAMYDNTRMNYESLAEYRRPVNSFLGWNLSYRFDNDRLYRPSGVEDASAYHLHTLTLGLPLSLYFLDLRVTPYGGLGLYNRLYSGNWSFPAADSYEPDMVLTEFSSDLVFGVSGTLRAGPVDIRGGWEHSRKSDTYFPGRTAVFAESGEVTVSTYFPFSQLDAVNSLGTRTYGRLEFLSDSNIIGTVVQDATGSFHLSDTPWVNLDVIATGSYEQSADTGTTIYYAPDSALALKGGLKGSVSFPMGGGSLGMALWLSAGGYKSGTGSPGISLQTEGNLDIGFYRGYSALTLSLYGGGTFTRGEFPLTDYWSFQGALGFSTRMPELLAE